MILRELLLYPLLVHLQPFLHLLSFVNAKLLTQNNVIKTRLYNIPVHLSLIHIYAERIEEMLHGYLWDSISVRDTAVRRNMKENFYHGMVLGLLQSRSDWLVRSNAETGEGYSDILVYTPDKIGIVIELKYADDGNLEKGLSLIHISGSGCSCGDEQKR